METLSRRSSNFASSSSSPAQPSMSSTERRLVIVLPPMLTVPSWFSKASVMILSRNVLKRVGENRHPCRTQLLFGTSHLCCCCLCYPRVYLRLGTPISYNSAQLLEACDSLKLLPIYYVDAAGVVCHHLGILGTDLHAVGCGGFIETLN